MRKVLKIAALTIVPILIIAVLWCPYETTPIPSWKLQVLDSAGKPVSGATAHPEWLDPNHEGVTSADTREADASGFVEFPERIRHNRLAFGLSANPANAHIFVCVGAEYGDAFLDAAHSKLIHELRLRKGSCPYG
jgi:hypothetical protein